MVVQVSSTSIPSCGFSFFIFFFQLWIFSFPSLQAVLSTCIQQQSSPQLFCHRLCSSTQCPRTLTDTSLRLGGTGCGTDHLCRSHFVLPAIDRLFHSPPTGPDDFLLSHPICPSTRGFPWMQELLSFFRSPT